MTLASEGARRWSRALACASAVALYSGARATPLSDAEALYKAGHLTEARALLEPLARADNPDPAARYYLAMALQDSGGPKSLDQAHDLLVKATALAPASEVYLAEFGGVCLLLADRDSSFTMALAGRNAMVKAVGLDPADLDAREGLMEYYAKAPWPLGDADKAFEQASEIARRNPANGVAAYRKIAGIFQRAGQAARAEFARTAAQNLARTSPR